MKLSLVVIAKNEEVGILSCLQSVPFADEIIVLDSGSTDQTREIARAAGATVIEVDWPGHVAQKNRALGYANGEWALSLDGDEALSKEAQKSIKEVLANPEDIKGWSLPRCTIYLGRPLRHGCWYPDRKIRVVRSGLGKWKGDNPHDHLEVDGVVGTLNEDIIHVPYQDFSDHVATVLSYSKIQAQSLAQRGVRARWWNLLLGPPWHFLKAYILKLGCLDGWRGLVVAIMGAGYVMLKYGHLWMSKTEEQR
jgi:glycosyltransferase involved in cell wall biosynthesis